MEVEEYILSIPKFTKKNTTDQTKAFFNHLGRPGSKSKIIHVAGTNGKGSVCAYLNAILTEAGYTVGMFTSPHLVSMQERIRVQGIPVSKEEFVRAFTQVQMQIAACQTTNQIYQPTFFELLFFMAMILFEEKNPDYIILETGMGGRLAATNVIDTPVLSIITEIGLDHTQFLGETIEKIAFEKAGIIKSHIPVVVMNKRQEATEVICRQAEWMHAACYQVSNDRITILRKEDKSIDFSYHSKYYEYSGLKIMTTALYQVENASIAIEAIEILWKDHLPQDYQDVLRAGLQSMKWEGRMEEIAEDVYLDGAHNEDGIKALVQTIRERKEKKNVLLFAVVKDKDYRKMVKTLLEEDLFERIYITTISNERALWTEELADVFRQYTSREIFLFEDSDKAYSKCLEEKQPEERIYVAGSLYLAGRIKAIEWRNGNDKF